MPLSLCLYFEFINYMGILIVAKFKWWNSFISAWFDDENLFELIFYLFRPIFMDVYCF